MWLKFDLLRLLKQSRVNYSPFWRNNDKSTPEGTRVDQSNASFKTTKWKRGCLYRIYNHSSTSIATTTASSDSFTSDIGTDKSDRHRNYGKRGNKERVRSNCKWSQFTTMSQSIMEFFGLSFVVIWGLNRYEHCRRFHGSLDTGYRYHTFVASLFNIVGNSNVNRNGRMTVLPDVHDVIEPRSPIFEPNRQDDDDDEIRQTTVNSNVDSFVTFVDTNLDFEFFTHSTKRETETVNSSFDEEEIPQSASSYDKAEVPLDVLRHQIENLTNHYAARIQNSHGVQLAQLEKYKAAVHEFEESSALGCAKAKFNLGICYENGSGVSQDFAKALSYYKEAAELDHGLAAFNVGVFYIEGKNTAQDIKEGLRWIKKAARLGVAEAQTYMGVHYMNEENPKLAVAYFKLAAEQNDTEAVYNLGLCYESGLGVEENMLEAGMMFEKASKLGNQEAQYILGTYHECGLGGFLIDEAAAMSYYQQAATNGHGLAKKRLQKLKLVKDKVNTTSLLSSSTSNNLQDWLPSSFTLQKSFSSSFVDFSNKFISKSFHLSTPELYFEETKLAIDDKPRSLFFTAPAVQV